MALDTSYLLSKLPYELLYCIVSYLTTEEAVRSSALSTRWKYFYHQVSNLTLYLELLIGPIMIPNPLDIAQAENIISDILLLYSSDLKTFQLYT